MSEWRPIPGFSDLAISESGVVFRIADRGRAKAGFIHTPVTHKYGHEYVTIMDDYGRKCVRLVHRLVLLAFIGEPPTPKHHAAHWDGNPGNNHVSNLRWATPAENGADTTRHGSLAGERNPRAKLTVEKVRSARAEFSGQRGQLSKLARRYGVSRPTMKAVLTGTSWVSA